MTITLLVLGLVVIAQIYILYQMIRNNKVLKIRLKWIADKDPRIEQYSYSKMNRASKKNWLGLIYPNENQF